METWECLGLKDMHIFCSYRTYEEWKLITLLKKDFFDYCSYRTYEEWKHTLSSAITEAQEQFLPYLWGMETYQKNSKTPSKLLFLPYLWGMETGLPSLTSYRESNGSYRTYEEWKLLNIFIQSKG